LLRLELTDLSVYITDADIVADAIDLAADTITPFNCALFSFMPITLVYQSAYAIAANIAAYALH